MAKKKVSKLAKHSEKLRKEELRGEDVKPIRTKNIKK